jgi:hypothetical protein
MTSTAGITITTNNQQAALHRKRCLCSELRNNITTTPGIPFPFLSLFPFSLFLLNQSCLHSRSLLHLDCFPEMPPPGYVFRDGGATPPLEQSTDPPLHPQNSEREVVAPTPPKPITATAQAPLGQNTSTSHQLATSEHEILGEAQKAGKEDRTTNLGWQANAVGVGTLVGGLPNDELWMLVRRFNKASPQFSRSSTRSDGGKHTR